MSAELRMAAAQIPFCVLGSQTDGRFWPQLGRVPRAGSASFCPSGDRWECEMDDSPHSVPDEYRLIALWSFRCSSNELFTHNLFAHSQQIIGFPQGEVQRLALAIDLEEQDIVAAANL